MSELLDAAPTGARAHAEPRRLGRLERSVEHLAAVNWHALRLYRLAHRLWLRDRRSLAMLVAAANRSLTGVELHPCATFGDGLVIMHGTGIVVHWAVTAGCDCTLYQQVTLGATEPEGLPPRLGDGVTVYAGARVLGDVEIGDGARIGANAVVLTDVPAGATAVGVPARIIPPGS